MVVQALRDQRISSRPHSRQVHSRALPRLRSTLLRSPPRRRRRAAASRRQGGGREPLAAGCHRRRAGNLCHPRARGRAGRAPEVPNSLSPEHGRAPGTSREVRPGARGPTGPGHPPRSAAVLAPPVHASSAPQRRACPAAASLRCFPLAGAT